MKNLSSVAFASLVLLAACGQKDSKSSDQPQTTAAAPSEMGQAAIIAVPVDSTGKESLDKAQMHVLSQTPGSVTDANIAEMFQSGSDANQFVSELDQTSSTESCRGWHNYRVFVSVGYHGYGYGAHGSSYGYQGYNNYQPTYYYQGNPYAMQYQNTYQNSSMNYYYYNNQQSGYQSPGQQYPNQQNPGQQYPNQQNPGQQYPNQQNPGQQYPNQQNPGQQYPNQQNPGQQYPSQQPSQPQQPQYPSQQPSRPQQPQYPSQQPSQPQQPQYPTPQIPTQPQR